MRWSYTLMKARPGYNVQSESLGSIVNLTI